MTVYSIIEARFRSKTIKSLPLAAFLMAAFASTSVEIHAENPASAALRVATFNTSMQRRDASGLWKALRQGTLVGNPDPQIANIAKIIRHIRPQIVLLNEFDYRPDGESIALFKQNYLEQETRSEHGRPIYFPYHFTAPSNTGTPSGVDFNNDSIADGPEDVYGFGAFPGQYGMVLLSQFPVVDSQIRTFQNFLWRDMPGAKLPTISTSNGRQQPYYSNDALSIFRLSSKSHWDIPIDIYGKTVHLLASHPTPPVFDGPEDRNGLRNHDEIRFWADYVDASGGSYIYDDAGHRGALPDKRRFIILGDLNASPDEGESTGNPIQKLLLHHAINSDFTPVSSGATEHSPDNNFAASHTTAWSLRVDYVLPSRFGFQIGGGAVFWPAKSEPDYYLVADRSRGSDHRAVWLDLQIINETTN